MEVEYFPTKNWYISKRNMELFEDRVQPCHCKVFKCQALGWLHTLYTGLARNKNKRPPLHQGWKWAFKRQCEAHSHIPNISKNIQKRAVGLSYDSEQIKSSLNQSPSMRRIFCRTK